MKQKKRGVTTALLVLYGVLFLIGSGEGLSLRSEVVNTYGIQGPLVLQGEYYRLVSGIFLHMDFQHLLMNGFGLFVLGTPAEEALGTLRFLFLYLASGLMGGLFSVYLNHPMSVSVGASGAILGLMGYLFATVKSNPRNFDRAYSQSIGVILVINLVWNVINPRLDVWGHLGGFLGGVLACYLILWQRSLRTVLAGVLLCCFLLMPFHPNALNQYRAVKGGMERVGYTLHRRLPAPIASFLAPTYLPTVAKEIPHPLGPYERDSFSSPADYETAVRRMYSVPIVGAKGVTQPFHHQSYATFFGLEVADAFFQRFQKERELSEVEAISFWSALEHSVTTSIQIQLYLYSFSFFPDYTSLEGEWVKEVYVETAEGKKVEPIDIRFRDLTSEGTMRLGYNALEFPFADASGQPYILPTTPWICLHMVGEDKRFSFLFEFLSWESVSRH